MRVDINLDEDQWVISSDFVDFKRDSDSALIVRFWEAGVQVQLAAGATGEFAIKRENEYDSEPLVRATAWDLVEGDDPHYVFSPSFSGVDLAALLGSGDDDVSNDEDFLIAHAEIKWLADGKKRRTNTNPVRIWNGIIKDTDGSPDLEPTPSDTWVAHGISQTIDSEGQSRARANIDAESPAGAQAKADQAQTNAIGSAVSTALAEIGSHNAAEDSHPDLRALITAAQTTADGASGAASTNQSDIVTINNLLANPEALANAMGLTSFADITAANASLSIGTPYFDQSLNRPNISTA